MKRKLALLLAAVMVIAAMPMNVFAASQNSIIKGTNAENATLFYENGIAGNTSGEVSGGGSDHKYWVDGTDLKIVLDDATKVGRSFTLELENAKWFFRHNDSVNSIPSGSPGFVIQQITPKFPARVSQPLTFTVEGTTGISTGTATSAALVANGIFDAWDGEVAVVGGLTDSVTQALTAESWADGYQYLNPTTAVGTGINVKDGAKGVYGSETGSGYGGFGTSVFLSAGAPSVPSATPWNNYIVVDNTDWKSLAEEAIKLAINTAKLNGTAVWNITVDSFGTATFTLNGGAQPVDFGLPVYYYRYSPTSGGSSNKVTDGYTFTFPGTGWYYTGATYNYQAPGSSTGGYMVYNEPAGKYIYTRNSAVAPNGSAGPGAQIPYELEVITKGTEQIAKVTMLADGVKDSIITIPLVMLTTKDGDYRVRISSTLTEVTSANLLIGQKVDGKTSTTIPSVTTRRNDFTIGKLRIKELKSSSLYSAKDWEFEIRAPRNYYFATDVIYHGDDMSKAAVGDKLTIYAEDGLLWRNGKTGRMENNGDLTIKFKNVRDEIDYSTLVVAVKGGTFKKSVSTLGSLYINGLKLVAEDEDSMDFGKDVYLTLRNSLESVITEEDVKVGTVTDYNITLTRVKEEIPTLVSGRLEGYSTYYPTANIGAQYGECVGGIDDKYHQAAKVKFAEKVADAWWAQRNTVFTLPEEVRFMKVQFDNDTIKKFANDTDKELLKGSNQTGNEGIYYNAGKRIGKVTVDNNTMTLTNLAIQNDQKASFEMDLWLSIQVDFAGEIDLVLNNKALKYTESDEDISCTIAKAIVPIEVITTVTEAKVGYQYVTVADFDIKETEAGNLLQGETVYVTVTDEISVDMAIAKGFKATVTEGNIKIKDIQTRSLLGNNMVMNGDQGAQLSFKIQRESSVASTISFTDVQVKIDRSVPYSSVSNTEDRGIDLHVWGPAVAKNYYYLYSRTNGSTLQNNRQANDLFTVAGISAKYVNVVTLPTDSNQSEFANHVVVTMGSTTYTINGVENELEVAPYVSTKSNSAMVPLRFVANALGLPETAVHWDAATSTATVDANTRIVSFTTGSSYYIVNGSMIPMVSPDGLPVEMEITGERAFVPFRALGEAFGIAVEWDSATSSAEYNKPSVQ